LRSLVIIVLNMKRLLGIVFLATLIGCGQEDRVAKKAKDDFEKLNWLIGTWKTNYDSTDVYAAWRKEGDSALVNYSVDLLNGDTLLRVSEKLRFRNGQFYLASDSVGWRMTRFSDDAITFRSGNSMLDDAVKWEHTADDHWLATLRRFGDDMAYDFVRDKELDAAIDRQIALQDTLLHPRKQ
jgi:hypothetical protein